MSLAAACRRDPPEPAAIALPAELAAYAKFQPGTWWVYQDSATAVRDSVWVVECRSYVQRYGKAHEYPSDKFEQFEMRTASSREAGQIKYTVNHSCPMSDRTNGQINGQSRPCWDVKRGVYAPNGAGDAGYAFVFPYEALRGQDQTVYEFRGSSYIYWHTTPQAVGDTSYADVLQVRLAYDASEGRRVGYEWARNVGIVRRRIEQPTGPQTWTLVRHHVVQ